MDSQNATCPLCGKPCGPRVDRQGMCKNRMRDHVAVYHMACLVKEMEPLAKKVNKR